MSNNYQSLSEIEEVEIYPGFFAKMIHTTACTLSYVRCVKGSVLPVHHHSEEQTLNLLEGKMEVTLGKNSPVTLKSGDVVVIQSDTPHSVTPLTDCLALDVFVPARKDYLPFGRKVR